MKKYDTLASLIVAVASEAQIDAIEEYMSEAFNLEEASEANLLVVLADPANQVAIRDICEELEPEMEFYDIEHLVFTSITHTQDGKFQY